MKNIFVKLVILLLLTTVNAQSQELKMEYDRTSIDTADFIYQTIMVRVRDFPENTNNCELISAFGIDETNKKIKPDYFLTQANREFWVTFKKNKNSKKITAINGKAQFFNVSNDEKSLLVVDNILEKVNKTIYSTNEIKIIVLDLEALNSKKQKNALEYKNEIAKIVKENKLNKQWFEDAMKKTLKNYYDLFNMIIYCEDPKDEIENIDELFKTYSKWIGGIDDQSIKTFFFSRSDSTNKAQINIKDTKSFKEIDFNVEILNEE